MIEISVASEFFVFPYLTNLGWLPYKQIVDHHSPGLVFFPINLANLGFTTLTSFKFLLVGVFLWQTGWIYKITKNKSAILLFALWWLVFGGGSFWYDTFLAVFTLPAYWTWQNKRWFATGLLLGIAVIIKQSILPLVLLVFLLKPKFRFAIGAMIAPLLTALYFYKLGIWSDFWYWIVEYNLTVYAGAGKLWPTISQLARLALPLALFVLSVVKSKNRLALGWAVFSVIGGLSRFGWEHFQPAIPFVVMSLSALPRKILLGVIILSSLWAGLYLVKYSRWGEIRYFDSQTLTLAEEIKNRTQVGDKIFLLGTQPHVYVLTETVPAGDIFSFSIPWILEIVQDRILAGLVSDPPKFIVFDTQSRVGDVDITQSAPKLVEYMLTNYQAEATVGANIIYANRH